MRYARIALLSAAATCLLPFATPALAEMGRPSGCAQCGPVEVTAPTRGHLRPTRDDLERIDKDNHELDLPAGQDRIAGAGPLPAEEDALTQRIEQDNPLLDRAIDDICPSCGGAEDAPVDRTRHASVPLRGRPTGLGRASPHPPAYSSAPNPQVRRWSPIYNGFNHQPTRAELRALHLHEFTPDQAQETDRLYDELMSSSDQILGQHHGRAP
jgi:hypothetical protein